MGGTVALAGGEGVVRAACCAGADGEGGARGGEGVSRGYKEEGKEEREDGGEVGKYPVGNGGGLLGMEAVQGVWVVCFLVVGRGSYGEK